MSYYERFYPTNPDPDNWEDGQYIGAKFYALKLVLKYDKTGKEIGRSWHALLTEAQLLKYRDREFETDEDIEETRENMGNEVADRHYNERAIARAALTVSERTVEMRAVGSGDLLHVFGPGRSGRAAEALKESPEDLQAVSEVL